MERDKTQYVGLIERSAYPKDSLFTSQRGPGPGPEEDVGFSTGDDSVWVSGVELHSQDHLVSGLKRVHSVRRVFKFNAVESF